MKFLKCITHALFTYSEVEMGDEKMNEMPSEWSTEEKS